MIEKQISVLTGVTSERKPFFRSPDRGGADEGNYSTYTFFITTNRRKGQSIKVEKYGSETKQKDRAVAAPTLKAQNNNNHTRETEQVRESTTPPTNDPSTHQPNLKACTTVTKLAELYLGAPANKVRRDERLSVGGTEHAERA